MSQEDLKQILEQLAARLERIERTLGLGPEAARPEAPAAAPLASQARPPPPTKPASPPTRPPTAPPPPPVPKAKPPVPTRRAEPVAVPKAPAPRGKSRAPAPDRASLELRIGQSWMAWVGAIVIVIGAGFLVHLGVVEGWWGRLSSLTQCLLVAGFGALLLGAGEGAIRRIGPAASVGLFGAGLGTLYLDAFAAFEWYQPPIVSQEGAFVLMGIVALVGFGITLRSQFLTIGILSITGGYLTPWLLRGSTTHTLEVGLYLTTLLGIALALSVVRPRSFRALRYVALGGQGLVGLGWVFGAIPGEWFVSLFFICLWWGMVLIESVAAALRRQSARGNVVVSVLSTAWFVTVGAWALAETQPPGDNWLGLFTLAVGLLAAAVAFQLGPRLSALGAPTSAMDKLAIALWAQFGVLLTVAAALQFDGYGQSIAWLAIGLASLEIGRRLGLRAVDIFGLVVGALAVGRVALVDWWQVPALKTQLWSASQLTVTHWSILALVAIGATHLAAHRLRNVWRVFPILLAAGGTLAWLALWVAQGEGLATTGGWLAGSVVLLATGRLGRRQRYFEIGLLALLATAAKWLVIDAVLPRFEPGWDPAATTPLLNWQMGLALAIASVGWWAARAMARRTTTEGAFGGGRLAAGWQLSIVAGAVFLLVAVSFEVDHILEGLVRGGRTFAWSLDQIRQLLFTMLWTLGAVGMGVLARSLIARSAGARPHLLVRFAWSLLALCAAKWLLGDTLWWAVVERSGRTPDAWPLANVQMLVGVVIAVSALALFALGGRPPAKDAGVSTWQSWVPVAAAVILLWGLSFEVDRILGRIEGASSWEALWSPLQWRELWWTALWAAGGAAMMLWNRVRSGLPSGRSLETAGWLILALAAVGWLSCDTVAWRLIDGVTLAPVVFNLQFGAGALTAAMLAVAAWHLGTRGVAGAAGGETARARTVCLVLVGLIGLWLGSLELDRFFAPEAGRVARAAMARQTAISFYWGIYAAALLVVGFANRSTAARYAGLVLLTLTLGKVVTVDLAEVRYVYRVLSFVGVGLLLVSTSVVYAKLAPRLGAREEVKESPGHEVTK